MRGSLDALRSEVIDAERELAPGEVFVQVQAVGLNFRDLLNVLGAYPGDPGPPGGDFAGIIMRSASPTLRCATRRH